MCANEQVRAFFLGSTTVGNELFLVLVNSWFMRSSEGAQNGLAAMLPLLSRCLDPNAD